MIAPLGRSGDGAVNGLARAILAGNMRGRCASQSSRTGAHRGGSAPPGLRSAGYELVVVRFALLSAGALVLAGCGGHGRATTPAPPRLVAEHCGSAYAGLHARTFWFRAADGTRLDGALLGSGRRVVVLATEYPSDYCAWLDYAQVLHARGYAGFLFDFRGQGDSNAGTGRAYDSDVVGAVAEARRRLAPRRVLLVGASLGGAAVVAAASEIRPRVDGVVSLAGSRGCASSCPG